MTLDTARLIFTEASPLGLAVLNFQDSVTPDNDYLRLAVVNGVENLALASATLHSLIGALPNHF